MKYAFRFTVRARRQMRALPQREALTILRGITPLGDDPRSEDANIKKLAGGDEPHYRVRVGIYRVIYQIRDGELVIVVIGVGHRREVYRDL